jgi:hypothetical protein
VLLIVLFFSPWKRLKTAHLENVGREAQVHARQIASGVQGEEKVIIECVLVGLCFLNGNVSNIKVGNHKRSTTVLELDVPGLADWSMDPNLHLPYAFQVFDARLFSAPLFSLFVSRQICSAHALHCLRVYRLP